MKRPCHAQHGQCTKILDSRCLGSVDEWAGSVLCPLTAVLSPLERQRGIEAVFSPNWENLNAIGLTPNGYIMTPFPGLSRRI